MTWSLPNTLTILRLLAAPALALVFVIFARPTADWLALILFVGASATDWLDGFLARRWRQTSRFGAMLDPIADKAMIVIALSIVMALSLLDPWLTAPAAIILFREVFVSGLREFLGADAGRLSVTKLAKWKTTIQMVAITVLLFSLALHEMHLWTFRSMSPADYSAAIASGPSDWNPVWRLWVGGWVTGIAGVVLIWTAAALTAITGWDYFRKALPYLKEAPQP
jgi:CDP-diacylglycerol--glycerol-3-phosphate 3-phosphatidyltransferase